MIYCITGDLLYSDVVNCTAVVDCGGVGYCITATATAMSKLPSPNENGGIKVRLFTYMNVNGNDNKIELFGFANEEELAMFKRLIDVQGVGPKAALAILSVMTPEKLATAILSGDQKAISKAPGIGAKTAARLILELKDKLAKLYSVQGSAGDDPDTGAISVGVNSSDMQDAADALAVLGYSHSEITQALSKISGISGTENIIRRALTILMK
ncbi:MAG: Holliday junction branch migration protein RuvA [Ruminococcaceae bacterium]|nr:Holliday junction branch migration protein RuvA [Oscillospiraceae bacterium]